MSAEIFRAAVDVCICTYRRPQVVETLAALARQTMRDTPGIRVVVADNSADGGARRSVERAAGEFALDIAYVHAPDANISIARNACLDAARADWIAFVDDDEHPVANWLAELLAEARLGGCSAVQGPVIAAYPPTAPAWLARGDFHSAQPVWRKGGMRTAFSGNILFRRDIAAGAGLRFRLDLGRSGGEDEDFFDRFRDVGGTLGFAPRAVCYEPVAPSRASLEWLLKRNFRAGQSHGRRLLHRTSRPKQISLAAAKAFACGTRAGLSLHDPLARNRALVRAALHCGVLARLCGAKEIAMY